MTPSRRVALSALLVSVNASCLLVVDPDEHLTSSTEAGGGGAGAGGSAQGAGGAGGGGSAQGAGGTGGDGGTGGGGGQPCLNTQTDPQNCGECGWDCGGGTCKDGVCLPFSVDVPEATSVGSHGDDVYLVAGTSCSAVEDLQVFPVSFDDATPAATFTTLDACGLGWSRGPQRAYYGPQSTMGVLEVCGAGTCERVDLDIDTHHVNDAVVVGDELVMVLSNGGTSLIAKVPLDATGTPGSVSTTIATIEESNQLAQYLVYDDETDHVWWSSVQTGGCVYREELSSLDGGSVGCFAMNPADAGHVSTLRIARATDGGVFAVAESPDPAALFHVDVTGMVTAVEPPVDSFAPTHVLHADEDSLYVGNAEGGFDVLDLASGEHRARVFDEATVVDMDVSHPDFVFFTTNGALHRWRKLPPAN